MAKGFKLVLKREHNEEKDGKFGPQQKVLYDAMASYGVGKEIDRDEVVAKIEKEGKLVTRQGVDRILAYYLNPFKKMGLIDSIAPAAKPKEPKADKPKKDTSPAAAEAKPAKAAGDAGQTKPVATAAK